MRTQLKQIVDRNVELERAEQFYISRLNNFDQQMEQREAQAKAAFKFDFEQLLRKTRKEAKVRKLSINGFLSFVNESQD